MTTASKKLQWYRLIVITMVHGLVDLPPGIIHAVLPTIQQRFSLSIAMGGVLLGTFNITCNLVQITTGHWRADKDKPLFQYIGLICCVMICLFGFLPESGATFYILMILCIVSAVGVAIAHPEALRSVYTIDKISHTVVTSIYMIGGIVGFSIGSWIAPKLVTRFNGLEGLYVFLLCPVIGIGLLMTTKIRMAVDHKPSMQAEPSEEEMAKASFWPVMIVATLGGISSSVLVWLLPQKLGSEKGGYAVMLFMAGGATGSFVLSWFANRIGEMLTSVISMTIAIGLLVLYISGFLPGIWDINLFLAGFMGFGSFPLLVAAAKNARGYSLGTRMGFMVGGVWGISSLFQALAAHVSERPNIGIDGILRMTPAGYILAVIFGLYLAFRYKKEKPGKHFDEVIVRMEPI